MISDPICPLCDRPIPAHARQSVHHLTPKLKGGKNGPTVRLHEICHRTIHATFTEADLARQYNSIDALRAHPAIEKFAKWIAKKDPAFHAPNRGPRRGRFRR
ncbi:MAG: HNH endonuclease [Pseudomonadota bacterium]